MAGKPLVWRNALLLACFAGLVAALLRDQLLLFTGVVCTVIAIVIGFRSPNIFLYLYAALIPFEDVIQISGVGTLSRGVGLYFALCYGILRFRDLRFQAIPLPMWIWFAWCSCTMLWAFNHTTAWKSAFLMGQQLFMFLLIVNEIGRRPETVRIIMWCYTLASVVTGMIAIQNFMKHAHTGAASRVQAFQDQDEAHFAALLVPAFLFCIYILLTTKSKPLKFFAGGIGSLLGIAILVSGTRSAWTAIIVSLAVIFLPRMNAKQLLLIVVCTAALAAAASRIPNLTDFINSRSSDAVSSGGSGRTSIWQVGLANFVDHPVFGVGLGNFPKTFSWDLISRALSGTDFSGDMQEGRAPHNIYLSMLVETGVIGLGLMLLVLRHVLVQRGKPDVMGVLVKAIVISYMVQGFFLDMLGRKYFWLALALAAGWRFASDRAETRKEVVPVDAGSPVMAHAVVPDAVEPVRGHFPPHAGGSARPAGGIT